MRKKKLNNASNNKQHTSQKQQTGVARDIGFLTPGRELLLASQALCEHSCAPSCVLVHDGRDLWITTLRTPGRDGFCFVLCFLQYL